MTAPQILDIAGRPPSELTGAVAENSTPTPFVRLAGDVMTGDLQAPHFVGDGHLLTHLTWANIDGIPTTVAGFGFGADLDTVGDARWVKLADVGVAGGVPSLDGSGKVPSAQLPPFSFGHVYTVSSQSAMLALSTAVAGDLAVRSDLSETFILSAAPASTLGNWVQLLSPGSPVSSVFGRTGSVTAQPNDYAFSDLASIPTDIAGFGLTSDFNSKGDTRWLALTGGTVTGFTSFTRTITSVAPTTLANEEGLQAAITWNPSGTTTNDNPVISIYGFAQIDGSAQAWGSQKSFVAGTVGAAVTPSSRTADVYGILGLWGIVQKQNTTGNAHFLNAAILRADNWGGTVDTHTGLEVQLTVGTTSNLAVSTAARGVWIHAPTTAHAGSGGTSAYGLYIDNYASVPFIGFANAWALYIEGGNTYFGGNVTIGGSLTFTSPNFFFNFPYPTAGQNALGVFSGNNTGGNVAAYAGFTESATLKFVGSYNSSSGYRYDPPRIEFRKQTGSLGALGIYLEANVDHWDWSDAYLASGSQTRPASYLDVAGALRVMGAQFQSGSPADTPSLIVHVSSPSAQADIVRYYTSGFLPVGITTGTAVLLAGVSVTGGYWSNERFEQRVGLPPASSTAAGNVGQMAWDANYEYRCTATNTWKRAALSTF